MADGTKIEWTDSTWNVITGCSVLSPGCRNCYAMKLAGTRLKNHPSRVGLTHESAAGPVWTGDVRFNEQWLLQPLQWKRPRDIFVCAHGDLFHENVPDVWIDKVMAVAALSPWHTHQVLTKRARRMREYFATPGRAERITLQMLEIEEGRGRFRCELVQLPLPNVWLGVSAERQQEFDERYGDLIGTPAAVRWLSLEPLLGAIVIPPELIKPIVGTSQHGTRFIDWVVVGGESGTGARPMHPDWPRSVRDQCDAAGVKFHFKQHGAWAPGSGDFGAGKFKTAAIAMDGRVVEGGYDHAGYPRGATGADGWAMVHLAGKKAAGRLLDGVEHNGTPAVPHA